MTDWSRRAFVRAFGLGGAAAAAGSRFVAARGCGSSEILTDDDAGLHITHPSPRHRGADVRESQRVRGRAWRGDSRRSCRRESQAESGGDGARGARRWTGVRLQSEQPDGHPAERIGYERFVERIARASPGVPSAAAAPQTAVLVDEAYHDYVDDPSCKTSIPLAVAHKNVIVSHTCSKIHGLAGLRCGYAIAHAETIAKLARFKPARRRRRRRPAVSAAQQPRAHLHRHDGRDAACGRDLQTSSWGELKVDEGRPKTNSALKRERPSDNHKRVAPGVAPRLARSPGP